LRVRGNSVSHFGVHDGDVVVIRPASEPEEGKLIVVRQGGGHTLKGYRNGRLMAYQERAKPREVELEDGAVIIGVLLETIGPRGVESPGALNMTEEHAEPKKKTKKRK